MLEVNFIEKEEQKFKNAIKTSELWQITERLKEGIY